MKTVTALLVALFLLTNAMQAQIVYEPADGPGNGKHIVLVAGDEEYRSEEVMPMLGKILSQHHGFKCTVIFSTDPETGVIDPNNVTHMPGLEALDSADMMIIATRFRNLPDQDMKHIDDFVQSGKPIMGLRTATHGFKMSKDSPYAHYSFNSKEKWPGGFGQEVLGETWSGHHGHHKVEGCRGIINEDNKDHPILNSVSDIFVESDVYGVKHLKGDETILVYGQVTDSLEPDSKPVTSDKNDPMMPVVWIKEFKGEKGNTSKVITTTMGAAIDLDNEGLRRLVVNSVFWALGLDVPEKACVDYVGGFEPTFYGFMKEEGYYQKMGIKPEDHAIKK